MQGRDKVVLSTIHQAKGLEWSVVFLVSCADGQIPLAKALKEPGGEEEERRLFTWLQPGPRTGFTSATRC